MNLQHQYRWKAIGPSGGGQTIAATISPHDENLIFVASDMGGIYRSDNGGKTFALLDGEITSRMCCDFNISSMGFHPTEEHVVYMGVWNGLLISYDDGKKFRHTENFGMKYGPSRIVFGDTGEKGLLLYNDLNQESTILKDMEGTTLYQTDQLSYGVGLYENCIFLCGSQKQYLSIDGGAHFSQVSNHSIEGFYQDGKDVYYTTGNALYCRDMKAGNEKLLHEVTYGKLRQVVAGSGMIYVGYEGSEIHFDGPYMSTILKSSDGGNHFERILFQHPALAECNLEESWISGKWGWYLSPSSMAVTPANPDMILYTNFMGMGISRDSGKTFVEASAANDGNSIQVMTSWDYVIDPHDERQHYIAMTDFSGWRSSNAGETWEHAWLGNPWKSNIYCIAPSPTRKGKLLAGTATVHDLPYWHWLRRQNAAWGGGIIESNDYGRTWFPQDKSGMGPFGVVTDICYYKDKVFAAVLGQGLYVSDSTECYWKLLDKEISHHNVAKISKTGSDIYLTVWPEQTAEGVIPGTIYYSKDGETFREIPLTQDIKYPVHILAISQNEIYVSCFDCIDNYIKGRVDYIQDEQVFGKPGLYHTTNQGRTWELIYDKAVYSTTLFNDILYISTRENGLYLLEKGALIRDKNLPVINPHKVVAGKDGTLYVTTFGQGVYKGIKETIDEKGGRM